LGGNIVTDAFGIVAMVAMTPLIIIQLIGVSYNYKTKKANVPASAPLLNMELEFIDLGKEEAGDFKS
ncbi:MAG TPA: DUF1538 domain-containing protein, partial [Clostridium sp.]|nr:DUF1538 domain-containing protein [Clostridium sp.]